MHKSNDNDDDAGNDDDGDENDDDGDEDDNDRKRIFSVFLLLRQ